MAVRGRLAGMARGGIAIARLSRAEMGALKAAGTGTGS
jgi:hypothetical protein